MGKTKSKKNAEIKTEIRSTKQIKKSKKNLVGSLDTIKKGNPEIKLTTAVMMLETQLNTVSSISLSAKSIKLLMFGSRISSNIADYQYVIRVISEKDTSVDRSVNCVEFNWDAYNQLSQLGKDIANHSQQKSDGTILKCETLQVKVHSKSRKGWLYLFNDYAGNEVLLNHHEMLNLLTQREVILTAYREFIVKKQEMSKKLELLKNLLAFNLNGNKLNNSIILKTDTVSKVDFKAARRTLENLWSKLDKLL